METKERLVVFLRSNHKFTGLPDDFGASRRGTSTVYNWNLPSEDGLQRSVELIIYPEEKALKVIAKISPSPSDFKEKYRENVKLIGIAKFKDLAAAKIWIERRLREANDFARYNFLLNISFADALPGTYRNVL